MKKIYIIHSLLCLMSLSLLSAQDIQLSAPSLAGRQGKLFYFAGTRSDSIISTLDSAGEAIFRIPGDRNYRGMATLFVTEAGGVELVVAEPVVRITCDASVLNFESVKYSQSVENEFIKYIFTSQTRFLKQHTWLLTGSQLWDEGSPILAVIQSELKKVEDSIKVVNDEISNSPLYAATYFRLSQFMNRLFETEQNEDSAGALLIRREMEESLDIVSLYTTGRLWENVHNFYASLFNHTAGPEKQQQYATSILRTLQRLSDPYLEAFLASCITETERFIWMEARDHILSNLLTEKPNFQSSFLTLQRAIELYKTRSNKTKPEIVGLNPTHTTSTQTLVVFYDSDCGSCTNEISRLVAMYPQLQDKGIRVVSISADLNQSRFEEESRLFPWEDKLCDFKGFAGDNFSNFNVIATPSFFLLDDNRQLIGFFYSVSELEEFVDKHE